MANRRQPQEVANDALFSAFLLSILGWLVLAASGLQLHVGTGYQLIVAVIGLFLAGVTLRRKAWPLRHPAPAPRTLGGIAWLILGSGTGVLFVKLSVEPYVTPLVMTATALLIVPWTKIASAKHRLLPATTIVCTAALALLLFWPAQPHPLGIVHGLFAWFIACAGILFDVVARLEQSIIAKRLAARPAVH